MDYETKRENATYSAFKNVNYNSVMLKEFDRAICDLRYSLDSRMNRLEFAEALKFIVHDHIEASDSKTTVKALEAIIEVIEVRMSDLAK
tara:strand:- start:112 stop:378 length:267 start_codon:yes stop_codon:yes gene_type:complete